MSKKKRVYVGMSGGVDSSVSAALLLQAGYDVTGIFIRTWQPDFLTCMWRDERHDAMRVCAKLGIPFKTLDLRDEYKRDVADYMIAEYRNGRTPNPDTMCNRHIKFGAFFTWAMENGADYVATGHYACVLQNETGLYELHAGVDTQKDQSYFLWMLPSETLARVLFPVGDLTKSGVREKAKTFDLHVAEKKDSQGVCFLGEVDMREFLKKFIDVVPGDVLDTSGTVIGKHEGAILYTYGQRHGFSLRQQTPNDKRRYVVQKDIEKNTITVAETYTDTSPFSTTTLHIQNTNWIGTAPQEKTPYTARIRYRQDLQDVQIMKHTDGEWAVTFDTPQHGVAPGQSCVIYNKTQCMGGGIIV